MRYGVQGAELYQKMDITITAGANGDMPVHTDSRVALFRGGAAKARTRSLLRNIIRRGRRNADLQPDVLVGLRLALDKKIASAVPGFYLVIQIIEDEIAGVGLDGEDRMALVMFVLDDRHQQRLPREAFAHEDLAFVKRVVLAIALAVGWIVPLIDEAPMFEVRHRLHMGIDPFVDPFDFLHCLRCQTDVERRERGAVALSRRTAAGKRPH